MPQHEMAIFCKSFRDDFDRLKNLVDSVVSLRIDTPMLISVPKDDAHLLADAMTLPRNVTVVHDESYVIPGTPFGYGWLQQQVCKLSVYRTEFADSYVMIDSDTYFISDLSPLIPHCRNKSIVSHPVFTKFQLGNDVLIDYIRQDAGDVEPVTPAGDMKRFDEQIGAILDNIDAVSRQKPDERGKLINQLFAAPKLAYQPAQLFHTSILEEFRSFLGKRGMDFYSCIKISPWEYNWYACFSLARWPNHIRGICSPVLHFADDKSVADAKELGFKVEDFQKHFVAIQMAARHFDRVHF